MSNDLVSIIVPVYNAEKFLKRCIESILRQSYKNIEVILINDGSTDKSGEICDYYSSKDKRVKVIHQKNSGPSVTRNKGIDIAKGKYIQFVDSDDYVEYNMTELLINEMKNNIDIVLCGYRKLHKNDKGKLIIKNSNTYKKINISKDEFMNMFGKLFKDYYINYIWNKLYITDIIKRNNIYFDDRIGWGEDLIFNLSYLNYCNKFTIIENLLYNYIQYNNNSITSSFNDKLYNNQKSMYNAVRSFLKMNNAYFGENKNIVEIKYTTSIVGCLYHLFHPGSNYSSDEIKKRINEIINDDMIIRNIEYFNYGGIQNKIIGKLIEIKSVNLIVCFFKIKKFIENKMKYLFIFLKKINNYTKAKEIS